MFSVLCNYSTVFILNYFDKCPSSVYWKKVNSISVIIIFINKVNSISVIKIFLMNEQWFILLIHLQRIYFSKGLPPNPNKDKTLLDLPDYSFLDGRPTPYGSRQKLRIEKQRQYTVLFIWTPLLVDHINNYI